MEYGREQNTAVNIIEPGLYEHYRGGQYQVIGEARFSEDPHQIFVVYKSLDESRLSPDDTLLPAGTLWIRPKAMFTESFVDEQGQSVKRFKKVD